MRLTETDTELLRLVEIEERRSGSFRPGYGYTGRAKTLTKAGYMQENGICAMWPYIVYGITDTGRAALAQSEDASRKKGE